MQVVSRKAMAFLMLSAVCAINVSMANAESLFQASAQMTADAPLTPRSLFTAPISNRVGDVVTIVINETSTLENSSELKLSKNRAVDDNGQSMFNVMLGKVVTNIPFINQGKWQRTLSMPTFDNMNNTNTLDSKAEGKRESTLKDSITCQVVQVLPNGSLVVQGQKVLSMNKERQDIIVTGIVNPYYLDKKNQIDSRYVANMQLLQGGKGVISRQQNDGIANKIYQFLN